MVEQNQNELENPEGEFSCFVTNIHLSYFTELVVSYGVWLKSTF